MRYFYRMKNLLLQRLKHNSGIYIAELEGKMIKAMKDTKKFIIESKKTN